MLNAYDASASWPSFRILSELKSIKTFRDIGFLELFCSGEEECSSGSTIGPDRQQNIFVFVPLL